MVVILWGFFGEEVQSLYQLLKGSEVQGEALMQLWKCYRHPAGGHLGAAHPLLCGVLQEEGAPCRNVAGWTLSPCDRCGYAMVQSPGPLLLDTKWFDVFLPRIIFVIHFCTFLLFP